MKNLNVPKVTVLMPVYDSSKFLSQSIESILNQTFSDFEFLIFNDGSTDNSADIIYSYNDKRIKFFDNKLNFGHVHHLNYGIETAKGEYIARMDADDISFPTRLEKQVIFMDKNPKVGVCGTWFKIHGTNRKIRHPIIDSDIRLSLLNDSALGHPTVMIRTKNLHDFNLRYDPNFVPAEDYLFWLQISRYSKLANLPKILLEYRIHPNQISSVNKFNQINKAQIVRTMQLESLLKRTMTNDEKFYARILHEQGLELDKDLIINIENWILFLEKENLKTNTYHKEKFHNLLFNKLRCACINSCLRSNCKSQNYNFETLKNFYSRDNFYYDYFSVFQKIKLTIKCLMNYPIDKNTSIG